MNRKSLAHAVTPLKFQIYVFWNMCSPSLRTSGGFILLFFLIFVTNFLVTEFLMQLHSEEAFSHRLISYEVILSRGPGRPPFLFIHLGNFCIHYIFFVPINSVPVSNLLLL